MSDTVLTNVDYKKNMKHAKKEKKLGKKKSISLEDSEIMQTLEVLKVDLDHIHNCLDNITDPVLIDSFIFEIQALNMRYKYYLRKCKEKGIIADF